MDEVGHCLNQTYMLSSYFNSSEITIYYLCDGLLFSPPKATICLISFNYNFHNSWCPREKEI